MKSNADANEGVNSKLELRPREPGQQCDEAQIIVARLPLFGMRTPGDA
jgi:hypothetical protein